MRRLSEEGGRSGDKRHPAISERSVMKVMKKVMKKG